MRGIDPIKCHSTLPSSLPFLLAFIVILHENDAAAYTKPLYNTIKIGALFENVNVNSTILEQAVSDINANSRILNNRQLIVLGKYIQGFDPVGAVRTVCDWLDDEGITTLISSTSCATSVALQAIMSRVNIPHLRIPTQYCDFSAYSNLTSMTLSIDPSMDNVNRALTDIIQSQDWQRSKAIVVFFDDSLDCQKSQSIKAAFASIKLTFFHTSFNTSANASNPSTQRILQALKADTTAEYAFIALGSASAVSGLFKQAIQLELISGSITWLLSTPKFNYTLLPARSTSATVTILQPSELRTSVTDSSMLRTFDDFVGLNQALNKDVYDAISYVATSIHILGDDVPLPQKNNFTCWPDARSSGMMSTFGTVYTSSPNQWSHGKRLYDNIKTTLDNTAFVQQLTQSPTGAKIIRSVPMFDIYTFNQTNARWKQTGNWSPNEGLKAEQSAFSSYRGLQGQTLRIVTVEEIPFMIKTQTNVNGSYIYSGFCYDLLVAISESLNFDFEVYDVDTYGKQESGKWYGAIGEVVSKQADMAVSGMTIIAEREMYVDFTVRYMDYGVGIILSKPKQTSANILGFLSPLSYEVWGCILLAIIFEGLVLLCITKVSPYTKYTAAEEEDSDKQKFKVKNSFWFTMSSVLQQGPEDQPRTISGRVLAMFWYFFTLIMVATYTANLAAFLTITRLDTPIQSLDDLVDQSKVQYGTVDDSSVYRAFSEQKDSNVLYEQIAAYFDKTPDSPVQTPEDGYKRVANENYAFMWDEPVLQYMAATAKDCDLMTVGKPFLLKGYGIALQRGIPYREDVNNVILALQESGKLDKMRRKWFEPKSICTGGDSSKGSNIQGIQISNVAGVFYVLVLGSILSVTTALGELIWYKLINGNRPPKSRSSDTEDSIMSKKDPTIYNTEMNVSYDGNGIPHKWAPGLNFNMLSTTPNGNAFTGKTPMGSQPNLLNQNPPDSLYGYQSLPSGPQPYMRTQQNPMLSPPPGPGPYYPPSSALSNTSNINSRQNSKESYQREATV